MPPSGIASRALMARLRIALRRAGSGRRGRRRDRGRGRAAISMCSPRLRSSSASGLVTTSLRSSALRPQHLLAAEREQLARELARALGRGVDLRHVLARLALEPCEQQVGTLPRITSEEVVEVVRDAAGEPADRLHLLRLAQLLLEPALHRHVSREHDARRHAVEVDGTGGDPDGKHRSVAFHMPDLLRADRGGRCLGDRGAEGLSILLRPDLLEGHLEELRARPSVRLDHRLVDREEAQRGRVPHEHRRRVPLEELPVVLFRAAQRCLPLAPAGEVLRDRQGAHDLASLRRSPRSSADTSIREPSFRNLAVSTGVIRSPAPSRSRKP